MCWKNIKNKWKEIESGLREKSKEIFKPGVGRNQLLVEASVIQKKAGDSDVMRVLVISDTHGKFDNLDKVLRIERPFGHIIHLGDLESADDYIEVHTGCSVSAVRGNNDFFSDLPDEQIVEVASKRILITHGHYYYVDAGVERLVKEARGRDVDIAMFGHTHRPLIRQEGELYVLNPGSLSYPRQEGRKPSYIVMEISPQGEVAFFLKFL